MKKADEIVERFAKALDAEDYQAAKSVLSDQCEYSCRGQQHIGPTAIIKSYQVNGDAAELKFDTVRYESTVTGMPDGKALIQFTDHLSLKGSHFSFQCQQVVEVGDDRLIIRIEHRDIPGQRDALAAFMQPNKADMRWSLRELLPSDQDFLWEMEYIALWDPPSEPRRPRTVLDLPQIRRTVENWGRENDFGYVAVNSETDQSVGAIWARLDGYDALEDYGCPYPALGIAVLPEFRGQGIGSFLMGAFITSIRPRAKGLRLGVHPKNTHARRLYEKMGFVEYAKGVGNYPQMKLDFS